MSTKAYVKKITTAACGITPKRCNELMELYPADKIKLLRVFGKINKYEIGSSPINGQPYNKFNGEFQAVNIESKGKVRSQFLILPDLAQQLVTDMFNAAKAKDPNAQVTFAVDLGIELNRSSKGGNVFKFCVFPVIESELKDPLDMLEEELGDLPTFLPSPAQTEADLSTGKASKGSSKK